MLLQSRGFRRLAPAVFALLALSVTDASAAARPGCDRACLSRITDQYLQAVIKHDPAAAPLAKGFRATENAVEVPAGQGLWATATGLGSLQRRYFDTAEGQAVYYGLVDEAGGPALVALRLKVDKRRITQAEAVIARKGERLYNLEGALRNAPPADTPVPAPARLSRAALIATVNDYFDAMQNHDGARTRHRPGCVRVESGSGGQPATGTMAHDCSQGFEQLTQISAVGHRHYDVVDPATGTVVITAMFLRPAGAVMPDGQPWKRNLFMDVVTTEGGLITGVYGTMHYMEAADPETSGWPP
jgi:hypothetical protein